jgi:glycosyltransferase involved in cell wall biosynthesis
MSAPKSPTIAFVIPCYNEHAGIQHTLSCLRSDIARLEKSKAISPKSYVLLVDDGSTDRTWALIEKISNAHAKRIRGLKLSRNVGHQNALLAGLLTQIGKSDAVISLDADLQDDMSVVGKMTNILPAEPKSYSPSARNAPVTAGLNGALPIFTIACSIGSVPISFLTMPISA